MEPRRTKKRPTSQDVADLAGVSVTTVSFVINEKSGGNVRISEETRRRVWEAVKVLNYRPSSAARSLRTRRSGLLALVLPQLRTHYHPLLAAAVQHAAQEKGFDIIIYTTQNDVQREEALLSTVLSRGVDGAIIHSLQQSSDYIETLVEAGISVVIHGNSPTHPFADNVMIDEVKAVEEIVSHLIKSGHVRVATIAGPGATYVGKLRKEGYLNALRAHDIPVADELIFEADSWTPGAGTQGLHKLLGLSEPPTAVFAASDPMAAEALLVALDTGLSVPEDVAIAGIDDTPEATMVRPRLTTVHKDVNLMGATATQLLMERIESGDLLPARQIILSHRIVRRESA
jgi:DNA-binding LacI/PurR family transcriptional regulator